MQILFFILAVGVTAVASFFNLGCGYIDSATWLSFGLSVLTIIAWALWTFFAVSKAGNKKISGILVSLIYLAAIAGVVLYGVFGDSSSVAGGFGLAGGLFFVLPFAGFTKLIGGLSPFLAVIPYVLLMALCWILVWKLETGDTEESDSDYNCEDEVKVEKETIYDYRPSDTIDWEK